MADGIMKRLTTGDLLTARSRVIDALKVTPDVGFLRPLLPPSPPPAPTAPPLTPQATPTPAMPIIPPAPGENPFVTLPFRSAGDRIKSDDFNTLSKSLKMIYDTHLLSGSLFGASFAQAKLLLASQQYQIQRVMTVFGTEIDNLADASLDNRKVVQVIPTVLGERRVLIVVTESVETRRFAPNLMGLTYTEALERLRAILGEITFPTTPINASQLVGRSLKEAKQILSK